MWRGYLELGGLEVANSARVMGYARSGGCPQGWFGEPSCQGFLDWANGSFAYDLSAIDQAPWYDPDIPERSSRFYGVHVLSMENISDSTADAEVVERVGRGARISREREGSREVRIRAFLAADGDDALEFGYAWLQHVVSASACGRHGAACGTSDMGFFLTCPPPREPEEEEEAYGLRVDEYRLFLHSTARTSGPFTVRRVVSANKRHVGKEVEFTITAEEPGIYGVPRRLDIPPVIPILVADIAYNLVTHPSAEVAGADTIVSRNYSQNPSLETNATDWAGAAATVSGSSPASYLTTGRVTGELAAVGTASFRSRILGNGSTTASGVANLSVQHDVVLSTSPALPANSRPSFSIWAAAASVGGATGASLNSITVTLQWRNSGGSNVGSAIQIGTTTNQTQIAGRAWSLAQQAVPAGADRARITVTANVNWSSSATPAQNSDIRLYADAAAVTIP